jgi:serine/threonine protein kinase
MEQPSGRVKILDFGLARFIDDDADLTQTGVVLGTPCFMSPEQARGEPVDGRSDLFSFGCVLYYLCTGVSPFQGSNAMASLTALAVHQPSPVRKLNRSIPKSLSQLVTQLLAKAPEERPPSAEAVLGILDQIKDQPIDGANTRQLAARRDHPKSGPTRTVPTTRIAPAAANPPPSRGTEKLAPTLRKRKISGSRSGKKTPPRSAGFWLVVSLAIVVTVLTAVVVPLAAWSLLHGGAKGTPSSPAVQESTVYLSSLEPIETKHWPFLPPPPPGQAPIKAIGGVSVRGRESPHGIFMHPPPDFEGNLASITYRLGGEYRTFHAQVSLNDGVPQSEQPFAFAVFGDDKLLWKSKLLTTQADAQTCDVSVAGVERLRIEVKGEGPSMGAHAAWIEPVLTR